jgi:hypothetical protein
MIHSKQTFLQVGMERYPANKPHPWTSHSSSYKASHMSSQVVHLPAPIASTPRIVFGV